MLINLGSKPAGKKYKLYISRLTKYIYTISNTAYAPSNDLIG